MKTDEPTGSTRQQWLGRLFPEGIPSLWCPPLTHYTAEGALDRTRIAAHLEFLSPWVKGLLVPGTTGDGWELTPEEMRELTGIVLEEAQRLKLHLLLGALHPEIGQARRLIEEGLETLRQRVAAHRAEEVLVQNRVCGFALCPPRGQAVSQAEMKEALSGILESGLPLALYQLPQITQNEMSPELVFDLARRYPNFLLFKDTSGADRVAGSGLDYGGVFLVRGMEGDYARWLKTGGGCYDGFLLSTANVFGAQLHQVREFLTAGQPGPAQALSERLTGLVKELFRMVDSVQGGNPFANANKLADHFYAHGPGAVTVPPPRLHCGPGLTPEMVRAAGQALRQYDLMPKKGYLE